jgi:O-antigen/teichoic acid export membrane protein
VTNTRDTLLAIKNAFANMMRGSASAIVALLLPPFLTRSMSADAFGAWSLVLQLSAYVGYLDFGIQTAIARFVAHSTERNAVEHRDRIVSTALALLSGSCGLAILGVVTLSALLPTIFHRLHSSLLFDTRAALLLVGGSLAIGLPASVFAGTFVGLQRNEVPAAIIGGSRLLSAVLVVIAVRRGGGIAAMAAVVAAVNVGSYVLQYLAYRRATSRMTPTLRISWTYISKSAAMELFDYCFSLTVWGIGMLLVTGMDLTIVGVYRFKEVAYYAVAATVVTFLGGLFAAIFGALGSTAAVVHARGDRAGLGRMVIVSTRVGMILLLATGMPLIFFAKDLLRVWVGPEYAVHGAVLLQILVAANIIRIISTPYAMAMIGSGEQRRVVLFPLLEGVTNLGFSVVLAIRFGALGVAVGTLIGAVVGLFGNLLYNMPRTSEIQLQIREYIGNSLFRPALCFVPIVISALAWRSMVTGPLRLAGALTGVLLTVVLLWKIALLAAERKKIGEMLAARLR